MDPNQPRPPRDMDGLIKFCLEASRSEDAPAGGASTMEDMDPERRVWLQQALASMSVDVIKELAEAIKILETETVQDPNATEDQVSEVEYAFECIGDWIGQLDMAMNFHQIGGFHSLNGCLESPHDTLRSGAANAIAELSQNNPYCQEQFVKENFLPKLLEMLSTDTVGIVRIKSQYAISCIVRECKDAQEKFLSDYNGPSYIMNAIMSSGGENNDKLRVKACFFISALCEENPEAKTIFNDMGFARQIVNLLQNEEHTQTHEHMVRALLVTLKDNPVVQNDLMDAADLGLKSFLISRSELIVNHEEFEDEFDYIQDIYRICYGETLSRQTSTSVDR